MKEEEKQMNSLKLSFEKLLQNERTLKIQVCVWVPTQVWKALEYFLYFPILTVGLFYNCYVTSFVVKNNVQLQALC